MRTAFDSLSIGQACNAMNQFQIDPWNIAAIASEISGLSAIATYDTIQTEPFPFNGCVRQGGCESGFLWRAAMTEALGALASAWLRTRPLASPSAKMHAGVGLLMSFGWTGSGYLQNPNIFSSV